MFKLFIMDKNGTNDIEKLKLFALFEGGVFLLIKKSSKLRF